MCAVEVRRGPDTLGQELWVVVSYHLGAENQTQVSAGKARALSSFYFCLIVYGVSRLHECL